MLRYRIVASLLLLACIAADEQAVTVEKEPPKVETKTFDRRKPPPDMPKLRRNEAAVTSSNFGCGSMVSASVKNKSGEGGKHTAIIEVESVKLTLQLDIVIWLPRNVSEKIRVHEEGHRKIDEHFYEPADKKAAAIGKAMIGKTYSAEGTSSSDAVDNAIKRAADEINGQYMDAVQKPSSRAQELYDEITDHGRNRVPEDEAIKRAIERGAKKTE